MPATPDSYASDGLAIDIVEEGEALRMRFSGRCADRDPGKFLMPLFTRGLQRTDHGKRPLVIDVTGRAVELGKSRFHAQYTRVGAQGRLIFLDDVYDCRALVRESRLVDLKGFFHELPLVISQKDMVRAEFKDFVSELLFDL